MDAPRRTVRARPSWVLNLGVAVFLVAFTNVAFFRNVFAAYPFSLRRLAFGVSLAILLAALLMLVFTLVDTRVTRKPLLITLLLLSSITAYFMDRYNVVLDVGMIRNVAQTDRTEARDLVSPTLVLYVVLLGLLPSIVVLRTPIARRHPYHVLRSKLGAVIAILVIVALQLLLFNRGYASLFREHKRLRYYANPLTCLYSAAKYMSEGAGASHELTLRGTDAAIPEGDVDRELIVLVIGETARADHFALNGYARPTNPRLAQHHVISLPGMTACGTSTAISLPCMFSGTPQRAFRATAARASPIASSTRASGPPTGTRSATSSVATRGCSWACRSTSTASRAATSSSSCTRWGTTARRTTSAFRRRSRCSRRCAGRASWSGAAPRRSPTRTTTRSCTPTISWPA